MRRSSSIEDDGVHGDRDRSGELRFGSAAGLIGALLFEEWSELRRNHLGDAQ